MSEPELIQQQREIVRSFWKTNRQRMQSENGAMEQCRSEIALAETSMKADLQSAKVDMNNAISIVENQRKEKSEKAQLLKAKVIARDNWARQQAQFRSEGRCLKCGERLSAGDRLLRQKLCSECRE